MGANSRIVYTAPTTGSYRVEASDYLDDGTGTYILSYDEDDFRSTTEGNGAAGALPLGNAGAAGVVNVPGDADLFAVSLVAGRRYFIDLEGFATGLGTPTGGYRLFARADDVRSTFEGIGRRAR